MLRQSQEQWEAESYPVGSQEAVLVQGGGAAEVRLGPVVGDDVGEDVLDGADHDGPALRHTQEHLALEVAFEGGLQVRQGRGRASLKKLAPAQGGKRREAAKKVRGEVKRVVVLKGSIPKGIFLSLPDLERSNIFCFEVALFTLGFSTTRDQIDQIGANFTT